MLNLNIAVLSFGILQSALLALALIRRKVQHPSSVYLVLLLVVVGLQLMFKIISKAWLWEHARTVYMISYNYGYLIGPLTFLFVRQRREPQPFKASDWLHFIPFVLRTSITIADEVFGVIYQLPFSFLFPWPSLQVVSMVIYGTAAGKLIEPGNRTMRQFILGVIVIESIIMFTILFIVGHLSALSDLRIVFALLTLMIYWLTYKMISAPDEFFLSRQVPVLSLVAHATRRYANSGLKEQESKSIRSSMQHLIEKQRIFADADITLEQVATRLGVKKHHLSQVINQEFGKTFTELVFSWRLDEAAQQLVDPRFQQQKISAIAYDLGFSSVSAFTTTFKKRFGVTPSAYRDFNSTKTAATN